jgi:pimeloyl-ACP methyl ester carboxylesterase
MSYREETVTVRDRHIRLLRAGIGQPLFYLHDTFSYTWTHVHDALAAHYEVLFPMHPGCAGSTDLDDIDGMDDLVFYSLDVCATLGLERPILLGPSLGGWLAAEWVVRYPEMLRALILVDAFGLRVPEAPATDLLRLDAAQMRQVLFAASGTLRVVKPDDSLSPHAQAGVPSLSRIATPTCPYVGPAVLLRQPGHGSLFQCRTVQEREHDVVQRALPGRAGRPSPTSPHSRDCSFPRRSSHWGLGYYPALGQTSAWPGA